MDVGSVDCMESIPSLLGLKKRYKRKIRNKKIYRVKIPTLQEFIPSFANFQVSILLLIIMKILLLLFLFFSIEYIDRCPLPFFQKDSNHITIQNFNLLQRLIVPGKPRVGTVFLWPSLPATSLP
jgi:hypothetical protein